MAATIGCIGIASRTFERARKRIGQILGSDRFLFSISERSAGTSSQRPAAVRPAWAVVAAPVPVGAAAAAVRQRAAGAAAAQRLAVAAAVERLAAGAAVERLAVVAAAVRPEPAAGAAPGRAVEVARRESEAVAVGSAGSALDAVAVAAQRVRSAASPLQRVVAAAAVSPLQRRAAVAAPVSPHRFQAWPRKAAAVEALPGFCPHESFRAGFASPQASAEHRQRLPLGV
jgi:hypothetical protein